jgi:hypothetical protein
MHFDPTDPKQHTCPECGAAWRVCPECDALFVPPTHDARYCSRRCQWRHAKRAERARRAARGGPPE